MIKMMIASDMPENMRILRTVLMLLTQSLEEVAGRKYMRRQERKLTTARGRIRNTEIFIIKYPSSAFSSSRLIRILFWSALMRSKSINRVMNRV